MGIGFMVWVFDTLAGRSQLRIKGSYLRLYGAEFRVEGLGRRA
jgi:hypothetical protein